MADFVALWKSASRKEVMDLLQTLWPILDDKGRERLSDAIVAGPPDSVTSNIKLEDREASRNRRIFDRIIVIERMGTPPLTEKLSSEMMRIRGLFPHWKASPGEQAHFSIWSESGFGRDTRYTVEDLATLDNNTLAQILIDEREDREGLLEAWRQLSSADSERTLTIFEAFNAARTVTCSDVWRHGLWGLRDNAKSGIAERLLQLLGGVPDALFAQHDFSDAVAQIVQAIGGSPGMTEVDGAFWTLFDRTLSAASNDLSNVADESCTDWVSFAINCSMGYLAQGFFAALFKRGLKVGSGIPDDLLVRIDTLMSPDLGSHRPARVVAASRLSYLYAIDPAWVERTLLPGFAWSDEKEALARWQGFAWLARIDPQLWGAIKPSFLELFTTSRLTQLGNFDRHLAEILMLAGVEFGTQDLPRDKVRGAIRAMPDDMRADAAAWIAIYLQQSQPAEGQEVNDDASGVDVLWHEKIEPWLRHVWPSDPALRSESISQHFAKSAIATEQAFPAAVSFVSTYFVKGPSFYAFHDLANSGHPERHPKTTIDLIEKLVDPNSIRWGHSELREILDRVRLSDPKMADNPAFRRWNELIALLEQ